MLRIRRYALGEVSRARFVVKDQSNGEIVASGEDVDGSPLVTTIQNIVAANVQYRKTAPYLLQWFPSSGKSVELLITQLELNKIHAAMPAPSLPNSPLPISPPPPTAPDQFQVSSPTSPTSPTLPTSPTAPTPPTPPTPTPPSIPSGIVVVFTVTDSTGTVIYSGNVNQQQLNTLLGSSLVITTPGTYKLVAGPATYPLSPSGLLALQNLVNGAATAATSLIPYEHWYQNPVYLVGAGAGALLLLFAIRK